MGIIILLFPEDFDLGDVFYFDYISKLQFDEHWHLIGYQRYRVKRRQEYGVDASAGKVDESYYINIKQHRIPKYLNYQKRAAGE